MTGTLKVAIVQLDIQNGDKAANILSIADTLNRVERDTDLVVLPELCTTGFLSDTKAMAALAESPSGETIDTIYRYAQVFNMAICGSFIVKIGDKYHNRAFFIEPSGEETYYDKHHLFSMSDEARLFSPGENSCEIIRYRGWNINMVICYDMRFPAWCRNIKCAYDILIAPANWPHSRAYAWEHLIIGRAIENQCYVIGANRTGEDEFGSYTGDSFIVNHLGKEIQQPATARGIMYARLDKGALETFREKFPAWRDADNIHILPHLR